MIDAFQFFTLFLLIPIYIKSCMICVSLTFLNHPLLVDGCVMHRVERRVRIMASLYGCLFILIPI